MKKIISIIAVAAFAAVPSFAQTQSKTKSTAKPAESRAAKKAKASAPDGATAICGDRSYSFSKSKNPCSGRGGVVQLLSD
ncbi:DUF3761 domain-containing protein [Oxalobacter sp. OttesenSCG-928-P03]|nr:DUF3761 domain-containing protein [Oxalobacter sp. OttesenSCG-928-P03]